MVADSLSLSSNSPHVTKNFPHEREKEGKKKQKVRGREGEKIFSPSCACEEMRERRRGEKIFSPSRTDAFTPEKMR